MDLDISQIDKNLKLVDMFTSQVYLVEEKGNLYVLKSTPFYLLSKEIYISKKCEGIEGATRVLRTYEKDGKPVAILKEYAEGETLKMNISIDEYVRLLEEIQNYEIPVKKRIRTNDIEEEAANMLRTAVKEMHRRGMCHLDIAGKNIVAKGKEAKIIDLDVFNTREEIDDESFFDHIARVDDLVLELWLY